MKRVVSAMLFSSVLACASTSAHAWGDREQGILVGAVVGAIIAKERERQAGHIVQYPSPSEVVIIRGPITPPFVPPRTYCQMLPTVDPSTGAVIQVQYCQKVY